MRKGFTWFAMVFLVLGYFIALPDEGTAATKKTGGLDSPVRASWNLKENVKRMINPGNPAVPVEEGVTGIESLRGGPLGGLGGTLPSSGAMMIVNPAADGTGSGEAASYDVFAPSGLTSGPNTLHLTDAYGLPDSLIRGIASQPMVQNHPTDPTTTDHQYFEAFTTIEMPGSPGFDHVLIGEVNPDQPGLSLTNLNVALRPSLVGDSFFDVFVEISYDGSAPLNPALPVFWLTSAAQVPEPGCITILALTSVGLLRRLR